jgi:two-component system response regulator RegA
MNERPLLWIVEDDEALRERLARAFGARGFEVQAAGSVDEATAKLGKGDETPEFVVVDLRMPGGSGLDLVTRFIEADPATRIVVLTGYGSIATAVEAVRRGAAHYLTKPADADQILAALTGGTAPAAMAVPAKPMSLDQVEWEHINRVLLECHGNISEAARVLGLHRRSLQRKLAKYPSNR